MDEDGSCTVQAMHKHDQMISNQILTIPAVQQLLLTIDPLE